MTFLETYAGHAAGVFASLLWMLTALSFTAAGHRIGTTVVNTVRIFLGLMLLGLTHTLWHGGFWPDASAKQVWLLAISGVIGLSIGDQALFLSFVYIGPRLGTLIMVTAPIWAALFGLLFLSEVLNWQSMLGIAITISGVAWVLLERRHKPEPVEAVPEALETPEADGTDEEGLLTPAGDGTVDARGDAEKTATDRPNADGREGTAKGANVVAVETTAVGRTSGATGPGLSRVASASATPKAAPSLMSTGKAGVDPKYRVLGIGLAFVGSICQAGGSLLSKQGMGHGWLDEADRMEPLAASVIRMTFAAMGVLPILIWHAARQRRQQLEADRRREQQQQQQQQQKQQQSATGNAEDRAAETRTNETGGTTELEAQQAKRRQRRNLILLGLMFTLFGTVTGPYLGMWMSLVAFDNAPLGIAQTLLSLTPIFILPVSVLVHREKLTPRAVLGAVIAVIGLSLFFIDWGALLGRG
ncbi:MAG: EamA family transporter [Planctomycetota bacterium]